MPRHNREKDGSTNQPAESANDNTPDKVVPFNEKEWRRAYMRRYMRELRLRRKQAAEEAK